MPSAWGNSWGSAWGDSWGTIRPAQGGDLIRPKSTEDQNEVIMMMVKKFLEVNG